MRMHRHPSRVPRAHGAAGRRRAVATLTLTAALLVVLGSPHPATAWERHMPGATISDMAADTSEVTAKRLIGALGGHFVCEGSTTDGGTMVSDLTFNPHSDSLVAGYETRDRDASRFGFFGVLGYDVGARAMHLLAFSGGARRGEHAVRYIATTWSATAITLYEDPAPAAGSDARRFTYASDAIGLTFTFELEHDGRWATAHSMQCFRVDAEK